MNVFTMQSIRNCGQVITGHHPQRQTFFAQRFGEFIAAKFGRLFAALLGEPSLNAIARTGTTDKVQPIQRGASALTLGRKDLNDITVVEL